MSRKLRLIASIILLLLSVGLVVHAQPGDAPLPLPPAPDDSGVVIPMAQTSASRVGNFIGIQAITNQAVNGGFETPGDTNRLAANWTAKRLLSNDRRRCETATQSFAYEGTCVFQFNYTGLTNFTRLIEQRYNPPPVSMRAGDLLDLSFMLSARRLNGNLRVIVNVRYVDGTRGRLRIDAPQGNYGWTPFNGQLVLANDVDRLFIRVVARPNMTGRVRIDALDLIHTPVNPELEDDFYVTPFQTSFDTAIDPDKPSVLLNDDLNGGALTGFDATSARGGTVNMDLATGHFVYTPPAGFFGGNYPGASQTADTFTYSATSPTGFGTATVFITVLPPAPVAVDDGAGVLWTRINTPLTVNAPGVLANDTLNDGAITAFDAVSAQGGAVVVNADGSFSYTPPANYNGFDTFTYTLGNVTASVVATVTISVDDPPRVVGSNPAEGAVNVPRGNAIELTFSEPVTLTGASVTAVCGTATITYTNAAPTTAEAVKVFTPSPLPPFDTPCTLTVPAAFVIDADPFDPPDAMENDFVLNWRTDILPPKANPDTYNVHGNIGIDVPAASGLLVNDEGSPAPAVIAASGTTVQGGAFSVLADGSFTYDPPAGFVGSDSFDYTITLTDGLGVEYTDTGTVTLNVAGVVWFLDASATAGGTGTLLSPFNTTAAYMASPLVADGSIAYLRQGTYDRLTLRDGVALYGNTVDLSTIITLPPFSRPLPPLGARPTLTTTAGIALELGANNLINGVDLGNAANHALLGDGFGSVTISNMSINNANGAGVTLRNATGAINVTLGAVTGQRAFSLTNLTGATGAITVSGTTTGTATNINAVFIEDVPNIPISLGTVNLSATNASALYARNARLTIAGGSVASTNNAGLELFDSRTNITLATLTSTNSGGNGLFIAAAQNPSTVNIAGGSITGTQGTAVLIVNSNITFTYGGTVSKAVGFGQRTVRVENLNAASTLTFDGAITCTVGTGIDMDNADGTVHFNGPLTLDGNECGFNIRNGSSGTFNLANATIQNTQNSLFTINGSNPRVTFTGALNKTQFGYALDISGMAAGGFFTMTPTATLTVTNDTGIRVTNTQGNVTLPSVSIGSPTNRVNGIGVEVANSTGTVTIGTLSAYTNNARAVSMNTANLVINGGVLDTTNETALFTTLGTLSATLTRISATNANSGIRLNETTGAGLTVTGTGTTAGSGGTISNTLNGIVILSNTGSNHSFSNMTLNDANTTGTCSSIMNCDAAIRVVSAGSLTLNNVEINRTQATGVYTSGVSTVTVQNSRLSDIGYFFAAGSPTFATSGLVVNGHTTLVVTDNTFTGLARQGIYFFTSAVSSANVRDNSFAPRIACGSGICEGHAVYSQTNGASNVAFVSNTVNGMFNGMQFITFAGGNMDMIDNTVNLGSDSGTGLFAGLYVNGTGYIAGNTVSGGGQSLYYIHGDTNANLRLLVDDNTFNPTGVFAINTAHAQGQSARVRVTNNRTGPNKQMSFVSSNVTNPQYDIRDNTFTLPAVGQSATFNMELRQTVTGSTMCARVEGNTFNASLTENIRLSHTVATPPTISLPFAPAYPDASAYLIGENTNAAPLITANAVNGTCNFDGIPTGPVSGLN